MAITEPFPYADAFDLLALPKALVVMLDGVTDPRNLGRDRPVAEGTGAHGLIVPRHGSAGITAVVAKSSAGAVEHLPIAMVTNLSDVLRRAKTPDLWSYAAEADAGQAPSDARPDGRHGAGAGLRGRGDPPARAGAATPPSRSRCGARSGR